MTPEDVTPAWRAANALRWELFKIMSGLSDPATYPGDEIETTIRSFVTAAIRDAVAEEREACAKHSVEAYDEYWRLHKEHEKRWTAWKTGGEIGECPTINIGALPDFIASAIRSRANEKEKTG